MKEIILHIPDEFLGGTVSAISKNYNKDGRYQISIDAFDSETTDIWIDEIEQDDESDSSTYGYERVEEENPVEG